MSRSLYRNALVQVHKARSKFNIRCYFWTSRNSGFQASASIPFKQAVRNVRESIVLVHYRADMSIYIIDI